MKGEILPFVVDVHCAKVLPRLPSGNPTLQVAFRKIFLPPVSVFFKKNACGMVVAALPGAP